MVKNTNNQSKHYLIKILALLLALGIVSPSIAMEYPEGHETETFVALDSLNLRTELGATQLSDEQYLNQLQRLANALCMHAHIFNLLKAEIPVWWELINTDQYRCAFDGKFYYDFALTSDAYDMQLNKECYKNKPHVAILALTTAEGRAVLLQLIPLLRQNSANRDQIIQLKKFMHHHNKEVQHVAAIILNIICTKELLSLRKRCVGEVMVRDGSIFGIADIVSRILMQEVVMEDMCNSILPFFQPFFTSAQGLKDEFIRNKTYVEYNNNKQRYAVHCTQALQEKFNALNLCLSSSDTMRCEQMYKKVLQEIDLVLKQIPAKKRKELYRYKRMLDVVEMVDRQKVPGSGGVTYEAFPMERRSALPEYISYNGAESSLSKLLQEITDDFIKKELERDQKIHDERITQQQSNAQSNVEKTSTTVSKMDQYAERVKQWINDTYATQHTYDEVLYHSYSFSPQDIVIL